MQKFIKRISLLLAVALTIVCMCVFASACGDKDNFVVTVYYSDGSTKVNGEVYKVDGEDYNVAVQFCVDAACYPKYIAVNSKGEAKVSIDTLENWGKTLQAKEFILHVFYGNLNDDGTLDDPIQITLKGDEVKISRDNSSVKLILNVPAP